MKVRRLIVSYPAIRKRLFSVPSGGIEDAGDCTTPETRSTVAPVGAGSRLPVASIQYPALFDRCCFGGIHPMLVLFPPTPNKSLRQIPPQKIFQNLEKHA